MVAVSSLLGEVTSCRRRDVATPLIACCNSNVGGGEVRNFAHKPPTPPPAYRVDLPLPADGFTAYLTKASELMKRSVYQVYTITP